MWMTGSEGDRRRWCPVHPSPAPSPHAPPRRLCAFQNRQWLPSAQDHCRRGGFERAGSGQVGQLLEALEALAVIVGVGGDRLDALTHGHRVRGHVGSGLLEEIGRASCRERVESLVLGGYLNKINRKKTIDY